MLSRGFYGQYIILQLRGHHRGGGGLTILVILPTLFLKGFVGSSDFRWLQDAGSRLSGSKGLGFRAYCRVSGLGLRAYGFGFRV